MIAVLADTTYVAFALIVLLIVAVFRNRNISAKVGSMEVLVGDIHRSTNGRPAEGPTLSEEVSIIAADVKRIVDRDKLIDGRLDQLDGRVTGIDERLTSLTAHVFTNPGLPASEQ